MDEVWKPVVGFEGWYSVSNLGRIRREAPSKNNCKIGKILKPCLANNKYYKVSLFSDVNKATPSVHSVVAKAFLGPCPKGYQVNHKDTDKSNNQEDNLEYMTPKQNINHAFKLKGNYTNRGSKCGASKLNEEQVKKIIEMHKTGFYTYQQIADMFNINCGTVGYIARRETWLHVN